MASESMLKRSHIWVFLTAALCLCQNSAANAKMQASWAEVPYKYIVVDQDIREILIEFGRNVKVPVKVSSAIAGQRIRGSVARSKTQQAQQFLQNLCDGYGLIWYYDGSALHISSEQEFETELIRLRQTTPEEVRKQLDDLALSDPRFKINISKDGFMLTVSGPPAYRLLVRKAVSSLQRAEIFRPAKEVGMNDSSDVRVFRGGS